MEAGPWTVLFLFGLLVSFFLVLLAMAQKTAELELG
jgi:hypothetical protein